MSMTILYESPVVASQREPFEQSCTGLRQFIYDERTERYA
jgi:hypothetical protein